MKIEDFADQVAKVNKVCQDLKTTRSIVNTGAAASAAVSAATGLSVAATSGAGITSGLAAAGGVVGGGMAAGPVVLAAGPAYAGVALINGTLFKDDPKRLVQERNARAMARTATGISAAAGVAGTAAVTVAGGASGAAIMSTLATIGGTVGGGAIAGTAIVALTPIAAAGVIGYGVYKLLGGNHMQTPPQTNDNNNLIEQQIATVLDENLRQAKIDQANQERIQFWKSRGIDVK